MLISEIAPINTAAVNLLKQDETTDIIDEIIELPLRKACKIFKQKGIQTVMSSANRNNITKAGETALEKEDIYGTIEKAFENHTFLDAGKGYAWLMLNFNNLSNENKDLAFQLEEEVGPKTIWFVHPTEMKGNIEFSLRTGIFDYDFVKQVLGEENVPQNIEIDEKLIEFEKRHMVLLYPWQDSSTEAIFLRMPINEQTTVEEVEDYFVKFAGYFKDQTVDKKGESKQQCNPIKK